MVSWEKPASDSDRSESRLVRVSISSTFRDMQPEREELVKITFPEMRKRCGKRRQAKFISEFWK